MKRKHGHTLIKISALAGLLSHTAYGHAQELTSISSVTIQAQKEYRNLSVAGATKNDSSIIELPLSVRVLGADLLRDTGATALRDALDLASGIQRQSNLGGLWDSYAMRGFTGDPNFGSDYMVNGVNSSRGYNGVRDNANTYAIEILKGPASALYGRGEPGGTINILTKKPRFQSANALDLSVGNFSSRRLAMDLTGPLSQDFAYRLNVAGETSDGLRDYIKSDKLLVAPSFLWRLNQQTSLSYEVEAVDQKTPFDRGVLAINGVLGRIPVTRFLGEPNDGRMQAESLSHQVLIQHDLNQTWSLQSALSYRDSALKGFSTEASALQSDNETLRRQRRHRDFSATDRTARIELSGRLSQQQILLGIEHVQFADDRLQLRRNPSTSNPYSINIYQPIYGKQADPLAVSINTREDQEINALYAQDQIDLAPQWQALIGVRHDRFNQSVFNRRNAATSAQSLHATSPRIGLVYNITPQYSWYLSSARGFRPNSGVSINNTAFAAEQSLSYETGMKWLHPQQKLHSTLALFKIQKKNVLTTNPINTDFSVTAGELSSQGLEWDLEGQINETNSLALAYAFTDSKVTRGDNLIRTGSRFPNVPRHSASLWYKHRFQFAQYPSSIGLGLQYVGERYGDVAVTSNFRLPAYHTVKLVTEHAIGANHTLSLQINNLFNKGHYLSSYSSLWVQPGTGRQLSLRLNSRF